MYPLENGKNKNASKILNYWDRGPLIIHSQLTFYTQIQRALE